MMSTAPIAIVGMACHFPGAHQLDQFWENIKNRHNFVTEVPKERWIGSHTEMVSNRPGPDRAYSQRAALIQDFKFDPGRFRLDATLLSTLDPLHQLTLSAGRTAFESCRTESVDLAQTGIVLAAIALPTDSSSAISRKLLTRILETQLLGRSGDVKMTPISKDQALAAKVVSFPATLLAAELGLGAGAYTLDAACASAAYALKLACDELRSGRADMMLTGGVSRPECLYTQVGFSQLKALSPSGRCAPFDAAADGLVVGEGAGILVLKRLDDALAHGDTIYGLVRGIGLSNDMRGNLLSPDSDGQLRAMQAAYAAAGWSPTDVDYIECHGTGTPTGDTIELESLCRLWGASGWQKGQCAIGSVKSMIGHLLTAASAAGLIKTLLAMQHALLPPSLNFSRPPDNSPLAHSPFQVQTLTTDWPKRENRPTRRAAVSAFGFGGINAHVLLESLPLSSSPAINRPISVAAQRSERNTGSDPSVPIAVVGMEAVSGSLTSLGALQEAIFNGRSAIKSRPDGRWRGIDDLAHTLLARDALPGAYLEDFKLQLGDFQIPPNEIGDILPQQLLMLKVAAHALMDANLPRRQNRPRMGAVIGIDFDMQTTDFHMRWALPRQLEKLRQTGHLVADGSSREILAALKAACGPPLTSSRTLGALGGIVASRIAREFRFGGPSFVVSAEAASGMKALEIGVRSLARGELDAVLVGAVDMCGDLRSILTHQSLKPFSTDKHVAPFDQTAKGGLPGEGAVAVVLKRLPDALADDNRIYALIGGMGAASGSTADPVGCRKNTYYRSLERVFADAGLSPDKVGYIEAHGSAVFEEDRAEMTALNDFFYSDTPIKAPPLVGTLAPIIGNTGAAAGLFTVVKACLGLYHQIIPPALHYTTGDHAPLKDDKFHLAKFAHYWARNRCEGPRRALAAAMTVDGASSHVILEENETALSDSATRQAIWERKRPLGMSSYGLFVLCGLDKDELLDQLAALERELLAPSPPYVRPLEFMAKSWYDRHPVSADAELILALVAKDRDHLMRWIDQARILITSGNSARISGPGGIAYCPARSAERGRISFVYPGSGNHYLGMGRKVGLYWPHLLRGMDQTTQRLKDQLLPQYFVPTRADWAADWEKESLDTIAANNLTMIFGQVVHGGLMTDLIRQFGISPDAVIGYSLGQSAGYFATGAWPKSGQMLERMQNNRLFSTELAGPCHSLRKTWKIPSTARFTWKVAAVNRSADQVRRIIDEFPLTRLLIVNTPNECVIGGDAPQIQALIKALKCEAVYLDGVVSVHCDAVKAVAQQYHDLHLFPTHPPKAIRYYSCAAGTVHDLTRESAAEAILQQALTGFDFTRTIHRAHADGIRFFVEMGPHASCSRMIRTTLAERPHLAESICQRGEDDLFTLLKLLGNLVSQGVNIDFEMLYGDKAYPPRISRSALRPPGRTIAVEITGHHLPNAFSKVAHRFTTDKKPPKQRHQRLEPPDLTTASQSIQPSKANTVPPSPVSELIRTFTETQMATAKAHDQFLDFSIQLQQTLSETITRQQALLTAGKEGDPQGIEPPSPGIDETPDSPPVFSRDLCMEFAIGSVARVLGPQFAPVDTYPARVRLPDAPLMLVDRILQIEGQKGSLTAGRVVTEHDVHQGAWYLDGNRAPVCIAVEAGQADLFLCAYLGIDLKVKGLRTYRLLDAKVTFHRGLPQPGETIRYDIHIDKFIRQQETYLFFFRFEGYIGESHLITMTDGCAGFFTPEEVADSGGIILTPAESASLPAEYPPNWAAPVPMITESYDDDQINALQQGDLAGCFGPQFADKSLAQSLRLPTGQMQLVHRVLTIEPNGGRYGAGRILAEADIHPDDWFLTCHFVDDKVMPGTLMYECCAHALRIFLQRMGWVTDTKGVCYEPKLGVTARLKCRGPVTPATRKVLYEVVIKALGYDPEPYAIADAHIYADGHHIVFFEDMSLKMTGIDRPGIEAVWRPTPRTAHAQPIFTRQHILEFAVGRPSLAFGEPYQVFDQQRTIARLPGPPFCFIDRITKVAPNPWELKPDGWVEAQVDVTDKDWYFAADRSGVMPFCVLLEIALQPCGWLAAYAGSALRSQNDLKFRNLGGNGILHRNLLPENRTLTMRSRISKVAEAVDMIIENFDFEVLADDQPVYTGTTYFGFFSQSALTDQKGLPVNDQSAQMDPFAALTLENDGDLPSIPPFLPEDAAGKRPAPQIGLVLPAKALLMVDRITAFAPQGGPAGLGYIRGEKRVNPKEWFFDAHFHQDPVCPGSLGIESFLQLLKFYAKRQWPELSDTHGFEILAKQMHQWTYRGQIIQTNHLVTIEAMVTSISATAEPMLTANGWLSVDNLPIYKMENFGLKLVRRV